MNNGEFIELLNLYIDQEISPEDALRLEAEVMSNPERRRIYQDYCRMQKACTMLSEKFATAEDSGSRRQALAEPVRWHFGTIAGGLAAAACLLVVFGARNRQADSQVARSLPVAAPAAAQAPVADAMKPVFYASQTGRGSATAQFVAADTSQQMAPLNWIGNLHMTPVYATPNPNFNLGAKADLKATAINDPQGDRDDQEPAEMTAFRFQR